VRGEQRLRIVVDTDGMRGAELERGQREDAGTAAEIEDALIAHTRKNAYLVFQEDNLGSIQSGKLADLVALDRDYLTVPVDQIKDIKPVMTIVGGRIVYDAGVEASR
jgi:predicted amidohydrolase YtcJ